MIELSGPLSNIKSSLKLGGSKSISNRLLILKEVLKLDLPITNLSTSEDTELLLEALKIIEHEANAFINIHHAGTDLRFLTALLASKEGRWTLTGSDRIQQRPISPLIKALTQLGAEIQYLKKDGHPPLYITGKSLKGGELSIDSDISSQFISALLLIAPALRQDLKINLAGAPVSFPYVNMTIELLKAFGVNVNHTTNSIQVYASIRPVLAMPYHVESDWSSASYWYSICALSKHAEIELGYFTPKSLQPDSVLPTLYEPLGVSTNFCKNGMVLTKKKLELREFACDFTNCPDIAQTLAVTCFGLGIPAYLTGLKTLKLKETDRILALKTELEKFGAEVEATVDSLRITPGILKETGSSKQEVRPEPQEIVTVSTYNDHRMALSFAALALVRDRIRIADPAVVGKSHPEFWEDLKRAGFSVNLQP